MIFCDIDPLSGGNQFTIRELVALSLPPGPSDQLNDAFFDPNTRYNWIFCASGTCFGAMLWVEADMANIVQIVGPIVNSLHSGPDAVNAGTSYFHINNGMFTYLNNATTIGNSNFSNTFWMIEGNPLANPLVTLPSPTADLDGDRDVDGNDFLTFSLCFNGSLKAPQSGCANVDADVDNDGDVDGNDFLTWALCHNGSLKPAQPGCLPPNITNLTNCNAPANDTCITAEAINGEGSVQGYIDYQTTSTQSCANPANGGLGGREVWYKYTPSGDGTATIDLCQTTTLGEPPAIHDTRLSVYAVDPQGCAGSELVGACQDLDNCSGSNHESVSVAVSSGVPVLIAVAGQDISDVGDFILTISLAP
jgi:hypothetical protein